MPHAQRSSKVDHAKRGLSSESRGGASDMATFIDVHPTPEAYEPPIEV
jgi:hypothetical protein